MRKMILVRDLPLPMTLSGILWGSTPDDHLLIGSARLARFDGMQWVSLAKTIGR